MLDKIDHIAYAVLDLEQACEKLEQRLGIRPVFGGYHRTQGTKNALLHLGGQIYLEILAIDHSNTAIQSARWMGIDLIKTPKVTRWAMQSYNIEAHCSSLRAFDNHLGNLQAGQRELSKGEMLRWQLSIPAASPVVDIIPFLIDWSNSSAHPTANLEQACELIKLELSHPQPDKIQPLFENLDLKMAIQKADKVSIRIHINSHKGIVIL